MTVHFDSRQKTLCGKSTAKVGYSVTANTSVAFVADYWRSWGREAGEPCKKCVDVLYEREFRAAKSARRVA